MPTYDYNCEKCLNIFEEHRTVDERLAPLDAPCPKCGEVGCISKSVGAFPGIGVDLTLTPDKKTGGQFSELMKRIKESVPERLRKNVGRSETMRGHRWRT